MEHDISPWIEQVAVFPAMGISDEEGQRPDRQPSGARKRGRPCVMLPAFCAQIAASKPPEVQMRPLALPEECQTAGRDHAAQQGQVKRADHGGHLL